MRIALCQEIRALCERRPPFPLPSCRVTLLARLQLFVLPKHITMARSVKDEKATAPVPRDSANFASDSEGEA